MSVYLDNIPESNNRLSVSQGQFLVNFGQLNTQFGIDHVPFRTIGGANGSGFHNQVTLAADVASPSIAGAVGSVHANTYNTNHELFYKNAVRDMQITSSSFKTYTPTINSGTVNFTNLAINGYTSIVGGMTFFIANATWDSTGGSGTSTITVSLPTTCSSIGQGTFYRTSPGTSFGATVSASASVVQVLTFIVQAGAGANGFYLHGFYI